MNAALNHPPIRRHALRQVLWLSAAALSSPWWSSAAMAQAQSVPVAEVALRPVGNGVELDGTVEAVQQSTLSAQASGRIAQLLVKAGDRVRAGQLLAVIDDRITQAGVAQAKAGVAQAEAQRAQAETQLKRTRELHAQGFVAQAALDAAETQFKAANAGAAQAQGYTRLTAPYNGYVLSTHAQAGDLAAPGVPVLTVYAPQPLRAVTHVPASRAGVVQAAQRTEILRPDGRWITPAQRTSLPAADPVSQTVEWRLDLAAKDTDQLLPGQQVRVRFVAGDQQRLLLPAGAVLHRGELTAVYVVNAQGNFALRAVRLGEDHGEAGVSVLAGVKAGDRVALDPVRAGLAGARAAQ